MTVPLYQVSHPSPSRVWTRLRSSKTWTLSTLFYVGIHEYGGPRDRTILTEIKDDSVLSRPDRNGVLIRVD